MTRFHSPRAGRRLALSLALCTLVFGHAAQAAEPPINKLRNSFLGGRTDTAINGYDTVAYFTVGKPVQGQDRYAVEWMGAKWKFASQANLDLFKANPDRYAPQYGGYCAYGVAQGHLVKVDPDQFSILDGKLYLNFDADVQARFRQDPAGYIRQADSKFQALLRQ